MKAVIGTKDVSKSPDRNGKNDDINKAVDDDLEMVFRANKASKTVVDDGSVFDLVGTNKKETAAVNIDKASRVLFPLLFVSFNAVYWVYFSLAG